MGISNQLVPANTYCIEDNKIGYIQLSNHSNNEFVEEYEAKQNKQRRFDEKFKLLNDEYYHKYFFEAVADNNLKIVQTLLCVGRISKNEKDEKKENSKTKWTAFDFVENEDDEEDEFTKMSDMDWLKWMNRKIDLNILIAMVDRHYFVLHTMVFLKCLNCSFAM